MYVQDDGHGAVVDELNLHVSAELAGLDSEPGVGEGGEAGVEQGFADGERRAEDETGAALTGVAIEGEVTDSEDLAGGIELAQSEVHLSIGIIENAETGDAMGEFEGFGGGVVAVNGDESEEAGSDLAEDFTVDRDAGAGDALDDGSHGFRIGPGRGRAGS